MAAEHDGYAPMRVRRMVEIFGSKVVIADEVDGEKAATLHLHLPVAGLGICGNGAEFRLQSGALVRIETGAPLKSASFGYSSAYGELVMGIELTAALNSKSITTIGISRSSDEC